MLFVEYFLEHVSSHNPWRPTRERKIGMLENFGTAVFVRFPSLNPMSPNILFRFFPHLVTKGISYPLSLILKQNAQLLDRIFSLFLGGRARFLALFLVGEI